jgi:hypothetical protein
MINSFRAFNLFAFSLLAFHSESFSKDPVFILYNDGTWEKTSSSGSTEPETAILKIQAGLTMKSGDTKPVSNTKFILTKIGIPQIFKLKGISGNIAGVGSACTAKWAGISGSEGVRQSLGVNRISCLYSETPKEDLQKINEALLAEKISEETTDFNGQASFASVPIQRVYINGLTSLGSGGPSYSAWSVSIDLKPGENKLILSNENLSVDFP